VTRRPACTGAILAGGGGTRLGGAAKGLLAVGGVRIVDRVAAAVRAAADSVILVAGQPDAGSWLPGVAAVADLRPGNGSLGGVHAALAAAGGGAALVVAWDMPFVSSALLARLRALGEEGAGRVDAVVPRAGGRREPLCAYYAPACGAVAERGLDAGDRRLNALLDALRVRYVDDAELAAFGDATLLFANVNTPDDLGRARARAGDAA
jgi:molybdopterin-guanine dinucleotide biosynthesis protein A